MEHKKYSDEIDLKQLAKRVLVISKKKKKIFTSLLIVIMLLSTAYFVKVLIKPSYLGEVILKSRIIRKDQLTTILNKYNNDYDESYASLSSELREVFIRNYIVKVDATEIKSDITSPDKNDITKFYRITTYHSQKPSTKNYEDINKIITDISQNASIDNDITVGKLRTQMAINELDSLLTSALPAGNSFKNKIESGSSMLIMNDLYKSLNELLARKSALVSELMYYQNENIIYKASPYILSKKISMPIAIFFIGFLIWFLICTFWVGGILVFGDYE